VSIAKTSTNPGARRSAINAISRRSDATTLATLEEIYNASTNDVDVRRTVLASISRMSDPRAVTVLARIARTDADLSLRRAAVQYLGRRSEAEANKALEELLKDPGRD
jgi:HEAT repeat protein